MKSNILRVFPNNPIPSFIKHADGCYLYTKNGNKILDFELVVLLCNFRMVKQKSSSLENN